MENSSTDNRPSPASENRFALAGAVWIIVSWGVVEFLFIPALAALLSSFGVPLRQWLEQHNLIVVLVVSFMYAPLTLGLICALFMPYARQTGQRLRTLIGLARWPRLKDVLYALPAYVVYFGISFTLGIMTQLLDRRYDPSQAQNLGISAPSSSVAYLLTFLMLVILPPLVEEVLFRGFLFGTLRKGFSVVPSSLITSALFGVAHGQFNLFLDTSALSLVLCYLRIKTGSLWAGMLLHAVKNLVAFTVLYVISAK